MCAASLAIVSSPRPATASANGNVAPSAMVDGRRSNATATACAPTTVVRTAFGSATSVATMSGSRVAAYQAAAIDAAAPAMRSQASQTAGFAALRASGVPSADPIANPVTNAAAMVENAYVVGPITSARRRVQATS